jgi:hypothetical protein
MNRMEVKKQVELASDRRGRLYSTIPFEKVLHPSALKFIAQGLYGFVIKDSININRTKVIKSLDTDLNRKKAVEARSAFVTDRIGQAIVSAFYNKNQPHLGWSFFMGICRPPVRGRNISYNENLLDLLADLLYDAIGLEFKSLEHKYRTDTVMILIKGIRHTGDFSRMPILADALMDADFPHEDILAHYRDPNARFSFGSWIFRASGFNCKVKEAKSVEQVVE